MRPFMLKIVIGKGHTEFRSRHQQDASKILQDPLGRIAWVELARKARLKSANEKHPSKYIPVAALLGFVFENDIEDT